MDAHAFVASTMNSCCNGSFEDCDNFTATFWAAYYGIYGTSYYGIMPIFLVFGLAGHILCLAAVVREARKDSAYVYQIFVSISQAAEVVSFVFYVVSLKWWSGAEKDSAKWFRDSYVLVWFTARLATPLSNSCITTSLLLSLCMAIDRFCALRWPHAYRYWNHKRNRVIALICSVTIGVSTSLFAVLRYQIITNDNLAEGFYELVLDVGYASTTVCIVLAHVRNAVRMIALFLVMACNFGNLKMFRARVLKVGTDSTLFSVSGNQCRKSKRVKMEAERTLFILVIVESTLTALGMTTLTSYFFAIFTTPAFVKRSGLLMIPLVDTMLNLTNMGKFYIVFAVDVRFRRMILRTITRNGRSTETPQADSTLLQTMQTNHGRQERANSNRGQIRSDQRIPNH